MAYYPVKYKVDDLYGAVLPDASVIVYLAGTTTAATIYDSEGGSVVSASTLTTDSSGDFEFWISDGDYATSQRFKLVMSKTGFVTKTIDDMVIAWDGVVTLSGTETITNKTMQLPFAIFDTSADHKYVFAVSELSANRTITLPLLTAGDEFIFANHAATLTGKQIGDPTDDTKAIAFILSGATTGKALTIISAHSDDRSITLPDASGTLMTRNTTDTLTNKTLTTPTIGDFTNATHDHSDATTNGGLVATQYVKLYDSKAQNTVGGTFTSGSWQKRTVTEASDTDSICNVTSSVVVLTAGTYDCLISCPAYDVDRHQARLYNTSDTSLVIQGTSEFAKDEAAAENSTRSIIQGRFTIGSSKNLEIQHRCETTSGSTSGLGIAANLDGVEIYTVAEFWRVA